MLKLIVLSDTQHHPWQEALNDSHWVRQVEVWDWASAWAKEENADAIVFAGDLFESKRAVRTDVLVRAYDAIKNVAKDGFGIYMLAGNHDWYGDTCTLDLFDHDPNFIVVKNEPLYLEQGVVLVPYGATVEPDINYRVMITHTDIRNADMGHGILNDASRMDEGCFKKTKQRKLVLCGHYHKPQTIQLGKNYVPVEIIGSPYHVNWSDMDTPHRGLLCLTLLGDKVKVKRKKLMCFPRFVSSPDKARQGFDFVRDATPEEDRSSVEVTSLSKAADDDIQRSISGYVNERTKSPKRRRLLRTLGKSLYAKKNEK